MADQGDDPDEAAAELAHAAPQIRSMEELAAYLRRGRAFEGVAADDVNELWADAFRTWSRVRTRRVAEAMNDLAAELGLRGLRPPVEAAETELAETPASGR